jgi:glycolate oxidase iron-sulfur subunit
MAVSDKPRQADLDRCVHCGLCLNSCPTYRELGVEMDSPRGRIYQMNQVANGAAITTSYIEHMELCLACRGCESACPSGVRYGRLIEAARAEIATRVAKPWYTRLATWFIFRHLLPSRTLLQIAAGGLWAFQSFGIRAFLRKIGFMESLGKLGRVDELSPEPQYPTFFAQYGRTFPAEANARYRVALLGGCIANVAFARLNEATVRVLQKNGCEVVVPSGQTCCGALHVHQGLRDEARRLARRNIDALLSGGFDAIITNAAGCGSTLKEYHDLFEHDEAWRERSREFSHRVKDVTEFLASIELNPRMAPLPYKVTYQDSCHLAHGQKIKAQPRQLMRAIPGLVFKEMPGSDICCGSAGIYNLLQNEMAMALLEKKMANVKRAAADVIATANPGCMMQLQAGCRIHGLERPVRHVVELLDEAYTRAVSRS